MLDSVENFSNPIFIKDNVLNIKYNLSKSGFNPNLPSGNYLDRFQIIFQPETLGSNTFIKNNIKGTKITIPFNPIDEIYFVNIASGLKSNTYKIIKY